MTDWNLESEADTYFKGAVKAFRHTVFIKRCKSVIISGINREAIIKSVGNTTGQPKINFIELIGNINIGFE